MKQLFLFFTILSIAGFSQADWSQTASSLMGQGDKESSQLVDYAKGLLPAISSATETSSKQASGGVGSLFSMVQDNLSAEDFSSLSAMVPDLDMDSLLAAAPKVAEQSSSLGSMLGSDSSLAAAQTLYEQFKALGLTKEQVAEYVDITQGYLQSEGGQGAVDLFKKGLGAFAGV
jgi:hypothetical protein